MSEFINSLFAEDLSSIIFLEGIEKLRTDDIARDVRTAIENVPIDELYKPPPEKKKMISLTQYGIAGGIKGITRSSLEKSFHERYAQPELFLYHQLRINKKVIDFMIATCSERF